MLPVWLHNLLCGLVALVGFALAAFLAYGELLLG